MGSFPIGGSPWGSDPTGSGVASPDAGGAIAVSVCASWLRASLLEVWNGKLHANPGITNTTIIVNTNLRFNPALLILETWSPYNQLNEIISSLLTLEIISRFRLSN